MHLILLCDIQHKPGYHSHLSTGQTFDTDNYIDFDMGQQCVI